MELSYAERQAKSGINVGDVVRVERKAETNEQGWDNCWTSSMDDTIGKVGKVIDANEHGFYVAFPELMEGWRLPYFALSKVDDVILSGSTTKDADKGCAVLKKGVPISFPDIKSALSHVQAVINCPRGTFIYAEQEEGDPVLGVFLEYVEATGKVRGLTYSLLVQSYVPFMIDPILCHIGKPTSK